MAQGPSGKARQRQDGRGDLFHHRRSSGDKTVWLLKPRLPRSSSWRSSSPRTTTTTVTSFSGSAAFIPSNSLACLYALAQDVQRRQALGADVEIVLNVYDESHTVIPVRPDHPPHSGGRRARDGVAGRRADQPVPAGRRPGPAVPRGRHRRGHRRLPRQRLPVDAARAARRPAGRPGRRASRCSPARPKAAWSSCSSTPTTAGCSRVYNFLKDLPDLRGQVTPILPREVARGYLHVSTFDAGRGCPFQCSFCTIINVQGRKSRYRDADDVERVVRANLAQGIHRFFITDDNFARNKNWEADLRPADRPARSRRACASSSSCRSIPSATRSPRFIEKAARAGCTRVFLGLESVNPENLAAARKHQNHVERVPRHAPGLAGAPGDDGGRLHPGFPGRHARVDRARHPHHPARAAHRHPGVLRADAAARLGRPPGAVSSGRADGPGHEPLRRGARDHGPPADDARRSGRASTTGPGTCTTAPSTWRR